MKFTRTRRLLAGVLAAAALSASCSGPGIKAEAVSDLTMIVSARHDQYVTEDQGLPEQVRQTALVESQTLRGLVLSGREKIPGRSFGIALEPVAGRHDQYVTADPNLSAGDQVRMLRSTELLRRVLEAALEREAPPGG